MKWKEKKRNSNASSMRVFANSESLLRDRVYVCGSGSVYACYAMCMHEYISFVYIRTHMRRHFKRVSAQ